MTGGLVARVRAALADTPRVREKRMFGSTAFMVSGKLCMSARPERIMCRIDPAGHDDAISRTGCRTVVMKGREYRGWVRVDKAALKTRAQLAYWIGLALTYNRRARPARKHRPRRARPAS